MPGAKIRDVSVGREETIRLLQIGWLVESPLNAAVRLYKSDSSFFVKYSFHCNVVEMNDRGKEAELVIGQLQIGQIGRFQLHSSGQLHCGCSNLIDKSNLAFI